MTLGQLIRKARVESGFTDERALAERLGVEAPTLLAWEADIERPALDDIRRLAELTGADPSSLEAAHRGALQGICRAIDLVPDERQAEALEQVGLPPALWADPDEWLGFLRLSEAVSKLTPEEISALARNAESCVARGYSAEH